MLLVLPYHLLKQVLLHRVNISGKKLKESRENSENTNLSENHNIQVLHYFDKKYWQNRRRNCSRVTNRFVSLKFSQ